MTKFSDYNEASKQLFIKVFGKDFFDDFNNTKLKVLNPGVLDVDVSPVSKGAFSIEDQNHYLISFDDALKKIDKTGQWQIFKNRFISNNIIQNNDYSTYDHKGIKVFVLN